MPQQVASEKKWFFHFFQNILSPQMPLAVASASITSARNIWRRTQGILIHLPVSSQLREKLTRGKNLTHKILNLERKFFLQRISQNL